MTTCTDPADRPARHFTDPWTRRTGHPVTLRDVIACHGIKVSACMVVRPLVQL